MPTFETITALPFAALAGGAGLGLLLFLWTSSLVKVLRRTDSPPEFTLDATSALDALPSPAPSLSIVVPARNEVANIEACIAAALAIDWPGPLELVVVDDRSTDGTTEILQRLSAVEPRLRVVPGADPPEGWLGKPHALHLAQREVKGDYLLFVDADVRLYPEGPRRLLGRVIAQGAEVASALGFLRVDSFWERVIQTRLGAIIAGGNPLPEVNDPDHERALANGQCLLFSRAAYDRLGGHEAIKGSVLDDVDFAKRAKAMKAVYRLYHGPAVFECRMYTGFREIWNGWTKNLFPALSYSLVATAIVTTLLFASGVLPFVLLGKNLLALATDQPYEPVFLTMEAVLCALMYLTDAVGHARHGYRWTAFWTLPLGMSLVIAIFWNSAIRITSGRGAVWKGRVVERGRPKPKAVVEPIVEPD